uniref:hypothetical protein n=1 Tax=Actinotalea sp. C106 TaxID=2908644 RepID=UPI0020293DAC
MSTIIMLPAPVPTSGRGSGSSGAGASGASSPGDFAAALEAVVEGSVRKPGTQQRGQQEGGDAQAAADGALVTVAQIIQAASGLLAEVGGTGLGTAVPAPGVEGAVAGETTEGETTEGEEGMAQVLDLTPRLAAALAAEEEAGAVPTQRAAT